jgi:DNA repair photolyase
MKTPFIYVTEMVDPVGRWAGIVQSIKKGIPLVLYTKAPVPIEVLTLSNKNFALSYTITGWGGTWLESCVPSPDKMIKSFNGSAQLLKDRISLRVDPIIPTEEGFEKSLSVIKQIAHPTRIVTSILQLYANHDKMAKKLGIDMELYTVRAGRALFVQKEIAKKWIDMVHKAQPWTKGRIQMCGMPYEIEGSVHTGCVDDKLLKLIGITDYDKVAPGKQRPGCKCVITKKQLIMGSCPHRCIYCYGHKENLAYLNN